MSNLRVAYLLKMFPRFSETFILNEILELERQGVSVEVFSLMHPADGNFHGRLAELRTTVRYLPREKPEVYWERLHHAAGEGPGAEGGVSGARWERAVRFLRRHGIPKDLDLLLRSACIARTASELGVQHFHAHFATISTRAAALVNELSGIPFSFTSHAKDIFRETVDRSLYQELVERAAFNVTVSDDNRRFLLEHTPGIDPDKVRRLHNGIDLQLFQPRPRQASELPHIVSVGRLVPKKGFDVMLKALALWRQSGGRFRCSIVGDGELEDELRNTCRELGLDGEVSFLGARPQEEVRALLEQATVVALACVRDPDGNQDALPTVLLESLAMDVPVVSTRIGGVPEIIAEGTGQIVEPGDAEAFAKALAAVVRETQLDGGHQGRCRAWAEKNFDLEKNVSVLHQWFEDSARTASRAAP